MTPQSNKIEKGGRPPSRWYFVETSNLTCVRGNNSSAHPQKAILGRNPDKSLKSFPPWSSQSPLQLGLEIYILQTHATSYSFYNSVTVHFKGGKPERKPFPLPSGFKKSIYKPKPENSQDYESLCKKTVHSWIGLQDSCELQGCLNDEHCNFSSLSKPLSPSFFVTRNWKSSSLRAAQYRLKKGRQTKNS